jgi:alkylhydroperoxidase/carboxymuconolactone decarboxylase family protein YurZ
MQEMSRMMRLLICLGMLFALTSTGCVPVLIGGAIYADAKKNDARQEFLANFHATNTEREKNGLEPLDLFLGDERSGMP